MRYHISFNEALRYLLEQGLPVNEFLRNDGFDTLLEEYIQKVDSMQEELRGKYDIKGLSRKSARRFKTAASKARELARNDDSLARQIEKAARDKSASALHEARWILRRADKDSVELEEELFKAMAHAETLADTEKFLERFGDVFHGKREPSPHEARDVFKQYETLEDLRRQLENAKERGDLFGVDEQNLKNIMGDEAYEKFNKAREDTMNQLAEALKTTGLVERDDDGVFKLTPSAARKVGSRALSEIFEQLKMDGSGVHLVEMKGEGAVETARTRPYEYGDPLTGLDVAASLLNAMVREGSTKARLRREDMEVAQTAGTAHANIVVMLDMSGSMSRYGRFHNAKKMALALDALTRAYYPQDSVSFIGFATFAKRAALGDIMNLAPEPVTFAGGAVNMRVDFSRIRDPKAELAHVPRYFTNMQKGFELARSILQSQQGTNKEIILITDGAPTAYYKGSMLYLTYPPGQPAFEATLNEVRALTGEGIRINAFLLGSDFDSGYFGEDEFIQSMLKINRGRLYQPEPDSLTRYAIVDYITHRRMTMET